MRAEDARVGASGAYAPGTMVAGRYRLESSLGEGGMATVYRALDLAQQKHVAVKLMRRELAMSPEAVHRFSREGELLRTRLQHPTIVGADTYGALDDGTLFMVMELLEGETLGSRFRRQGRMPAHVIAPILTGVCAGLQFAHKNGVLHRDLKPDNIFIVRDSNPDEVRIKLLDFGISKISGAEKLTQTGQVVGTPRYMAPEQLLGEDVDVRVDVYALGVILYELLSGAPPFVAATPSDLIMLILRGNPTPLLSAQPDVAPELAGIVMRAMSKSRTARYDSVVDLANAFVSAVAPAIPAHARISSPNEEESPKETRVLGSMSNTQLGRVRKASKPPLEAGTFEHYSQPEPSEPPIAPPSPLGTMGAYAPTQLSVAPESREGVAAHGDPVVTKPQNLRKDIPKTRISEPEPDMTMPSTPRSIRPAAPEPRASTSQEREIVTTGEMLASAGLAPSRSSSATSWLVVIMAALAGAGLAAWAALTLFR